MSDNLNGIIKVQTPEDRQGEEFLEEIKPMMSTVVDAQKMEELSKNDSDEFAARIDAAAAAEEANADEIIKEYGLNQDGTRPEKPINPEVSIQNESVDGDAAMPSFSEDDSQDPETSANKTDSHYMHESPTLQMNEDSPILSAVKGMVADKPSTGSQDVVILDNPQSNSAEVVSDETLLPSFTDEDADKADEKELTEEEAENEIDELANLTIVDYVPGEITHKSFEIRGEKIAVRTTASKHVVSDKEFTEALLRNDKVVKRKFLAPLINSGFIAESLGAGIIDFITVFDVTERTETLQYEIRKMEALLKSIIGTRPKIKPSMVSELLHYSDYDTLAHAYLCGTQKHVNYPATCKKCEKDYMIKSDPAYIITNMPKIESKIAKLMSAGMNEDVQSLTAVTHEVTDEESGYSIVLKHPSWAKYLKTLKEIRGHVDVQTKAEMMQMIQILINIDKIILPDGTEGANAFQNYVALKRISQTHYETIITATQQLQDQITRIEYGFTDVACPHCSEPNSEVIEGIDSLIFFDITAYKAYQKVKNKQKLSQNGQKQ